MAEDIIRTLTVKRALIPKGAGRVKAEGNDRPAGYFAGSMSGIDIRKSYGFLVFMYIFPGSLVAQTMRSMNNGIERVHQANTHQDSGDDDNVLC